MFCVLRVSRLSSCEGGQGVPLGMRVSEICLLPFDIQRIAIRSPLHYRDRYRHLHCLHSELVRAAALPRAFITGLMRINIGSGQGWMNQCCQVSTGDNIVIRESCIESQYTPPPPRTVLWTPGKPNFVCGSGTGVGYCCQNDLGYAGTYNGCAPTSGGIYDPERGETTWAGW